MIFHRFVQLHKNVIFNPRDKGLPLMVILCFNLLEQICGDSNSQVQPFPQQNVSFLLSEQ